MKRIIRVLVLTTLLALMMMCYTYANTINIPADYTTIQAGIDAAVIGDTVLVNPGTYTENINFSGKNITVASLFLTTQDTSYISQTIIDGNQNGHVVKFDTGTDSTSTALLTGFIITNGHSTSGGGIYCDIDTNPRLENIIIKGNSADASGGGIYCYNSSPYLENVIIKGNSTGGCGGGIYCFYFAEPNFVNVTIKGNSAVAFGGGMFFSTSTTSKLLDVIITENSARSGGGIYVETASLLGLAKVEITGNSASEDGGGIYCNYCVFLLQYVTISGNSAKNGGGIHSYYHADGNLVNVEITGNSASENGGGIYCELSGSSFLLENVTISGNSANDDGGGLYLYSAHLLFQNVTITENCSEGAGGGLFCIYSKPSLENVTISGNSANDDGGGLYLYNSYIGFQDVTIIENCSEGDGGGIFCRRTNPTFTLAHVEISDNSAAGYGGGVYCDSLCDLSLENITITENSASENGGAIYCDSTSSISLLNCILWNDLPQEIDCLADSSIAIRYSDIQGAWTGIGNIDEDPLFLDPVNGDYHLSWANYPVSDYTKSPCIDAGDPDSPLDPDGTRADMGAYYFHQGVSVDEPTIPTEYSLTNYPNPIDANINKLTLSFFINKPGNVSIQLFNIKGQLVSTLIDKYINVGSYTISKEIDDLSPGIYFSRLNIDGVMREVEKLVVLK